MHLTHFSHWLPVITKAIFQQHGFRFGVHSTVGRGTVFWFIMTDAEEASA